MQAYQKKSIRTTDVKPATIVTQACFLDLRNFTTN